MIICGMVIFVGYKTSLRKEHILCCKQQADSTKWFQHYVLKFVNDLRQFDGFLLVLRFPPPIKLTATI